ncbi:hypothetical protein Tco_1034176 [Tanacetum coccineum]
MFEHGLHKEHKEIKGVFTQMETEVAKCFVDKKYFKIEKKELSLDNDRLLEHIICQDVMNVVMHANDHHDNVLPLLISQDLVHTAINSLTAINDYKSMEQICVDEYEENLKLQTELANKNDMIKKAVYNKLSKRYLPPLSPCIKNNLAAHIDYLKHTQANANILHEIIEDAIELRPFDSNLASACKFVIRIQELLVYVSATCPSTKNASDKLVAVTPMNKTRKVSNKKKNKVEDQPRIAKSSLNNVNHISKIVCNENVKHSVLNANSELVCATCHECMFDAIHDQCVHDYLIDVNAHVKSKSVKSKSTKSKKKKT